MQSSKVIAKSLAHLVASGKDPVVVAEKLRGALNGTSRMPQLPSIIFYLKKHLAEESSFNTFFVEVAEEAGDSLAKKISSVTKDTPRVIVNEDIIGGVRILHKGILYDATVRTRLEKLREAIVT